MKKILLSLIVLFGLFLGCKEKDTELVKPALVTTSTDVTNYVTRTDNTPSLSGGRTQEVRAYYYNDLDLRTTYDMTINYNGSLRQINLFHHPLFKGYIDRETRMDVKSEDGWELIYNWFPTNTTDQVQFPGLLMYNKFRGSMKLFYYHLSGLSTAGNVIGALSGVTTPVKLFNLNTSITDVTSSSYSNVVTQSTDGMFNVTGSGLIENNWYAFEWDVAYYDGSVGPGSFLSLRGWGQDLSTVTLQGSLSGNISGKLTTIVASKDINNLGTTSDIEKAISNGTKSIFIKTPGEQLKNLFTNLSNKTSSGFLKNIFGKVASDGTISGIATAIAGPIGGFLAKPISALLGKLFPKKKTETNPVSIQETQVNLKADLNLAISGTIERTPPFGRIEFEIPTKKINDWSYFGKLGVFSLKSKPTVAVVEDYVFYMSGPPMDVNNWRYAFYAWLKDDLSNLVVVNPDLLNEATVESTAQIVYYATASDVSSSIEEYSSQKYPILNENVDETKIIVPLVGSLSTPYSPPTSPWCCASDSPRVVLKNKPGYIPTTRSQYIVRGPSSSTKLTMPWASKYNNLKVLVTIKVSPKNGSNPVWFNQLFEPTLIQSQQYSPIPTVYYNPY